MNVWITRVGAAFALGLPNVARVLVYRLGLATGMARVCRLRARPAQGPFFEAPAPGLQPIEGVEEAPLLLFGWHPVDLSGPAPDWLANPLTGQRVTAPLRNWWTMPDFDPVLGDIKPIWELSRFDWVLALALRVRSGSPQQAARALAQLNAWLGDWSERNPPYLGPNWKCAQEASLRVLHLAAAALVLRQVQQAAPGLRSLLALHLARIAPTVSYAIAQDNNHGTSEASALYVGGSWLLALGDAGARRWMQAGRGLLEERVGRLVASDGTFSQYSLNYHRLMLDTLSMAELWRRQLGLSPFPDAWCARARAAAYWLFRLIDARTGDGPNVGANDGAWILRFGATHDRDFRPSVELATVLFAGQGAYGGADGSARALAWLGLDRPATALAVPPSDAGDAGGFAVLRHGAALALLRYPRFRFRPAQADALHVDVWRDGNNLLPDAGSYSYHTDARWLGYFGGTASHNTVAFDGRDQMPRIGRFLFGRWLQTSMIAPLIVTDAQVCFGAGYEDAWGARHHRRVCLHDSGFDVIDVVDGFAAKAILRWRLRPGRWQVDGNQVSLDGQVLSVTASVPIARCELVEGWVSTRYLRMEALPVLEVEIRQPGSFTTSYRWAA